MFDLMPQIDGAAVAHDRLHTARELPVLSVVIRDCRSVRHPQQQRQMSARRVPPGSDRIGVDLVFLRMRPQPPDRTSAILQRSWKPSLTREPVVDRDRHEPELREVEDIPRRTIPRRREARLVPLQPPTAMNHHNRRPQLPRRVARHRQIEAPVVLHSVPVSQVV